MSFNCNARSFRLACGHEAPVETIPRLFHHDVCSYCREPLLPTDKLFLLDLLRLADYFHDGTGFYSCGEEEEDDDDEEEEDECNNPSSPPASPVPHTEEPKYSPSSPIYSSPVYRPTSPSCFSDASVEILDDDEEEDSSVEIIDDDDEENSAVEILDDEDTVEALINEPVEPLVASLRKRMRECDLALKRLNDSLHLNSEEEEALDEFLSSPPPKRRSF